MSDALKYLMKVRPEVMENYFSFVKKSGEHLDDKTKIIISVITKVDKQTDKGFRQYLKRALAIGVSPNEVLDALFVAFPTLGLSKIVWAVDIVLSMEIPGFEEDNLFAEQVWHEVIATDELNLDVNYIKDCDGKDLFIYNSEGRIKVFDSLCPHQSTAIPDSALSENILTCPKHKWQFDIKNGDCVDPGNQNLRQFENKIEDNILSALW